jgi:hypothetical protein
VRDRFHLVRLEPVRCDRHISRTRRIHCSSSSRGNVRWGCDVPYWREKVVTCCLIALSLTLQSRRRLVTSPIIGSIVLVRLLIAGVALAARQFVIRVWCGVAILTNKRATIINDLLSMCGEAARGDVRATEGVDGLSLHGNSIWFILY